MLDPASTSMFGRLAAALGDDWPGKARPEQLPPPGDWNIWLILSGRGWGKTRTGAEWVKSQIASGQARRVALVGATAADVRNVMIEGASGLLSICADWDRPTYEPSKRRVTFKNGAVVTAYSAEEADRLRGPQHDLAWCDELAAWTNLQAVWDQLQFGLRLGAKPRICVTTTPRPLKLLKSLIARPDVHVTKGKTSDNASNLAPTFLSAIVTRYEGTRLGRQELNGEILSDVQGALWSRDLVEETRIQKGSEPPMRRVVVAVDPATSVGENSDLTGVVVAGLGDDGNGYILEDLSGRYNPIQWATTAIAAYRRHRADRIVAESNQGGLMVESTLRAVDRTIPIRLVHASRGKITRAEPISALFEQHRAHIVGCLPELEDELCSFEPGSANSPDRLDAAVYALTDLQISWQSVVSFHVPCAGPTRAEIAAANLNIADFTSSPPGGWPMGSPQASAVGGQFGWKLPR
ncbi:DNA-packaging protein [Methylocapsa palsarum]|uniref:Large terminase phage packaging protein n=1 Tax=Methylocapsa palsarum TaxID=1612308 RepID=A0A1I4CQB0_9HYPH|nr:terminase family protein [Methylocapsa palsarum]SFK83484.1 Large terminase phage packaging protein [Methylocapsa palsarum]